jgi:hypothetical protein
MFCFAVDAQISSLISAQAQDVAFTVPADLVIFIGKAAGQFFDFDCLADAYLWDTLPNRGKVVHINPFTNKADIILYGLTLDRLQSSFFAAFCRSRVNNWGFLIRILFFRNKIPQLIERCPVFWFAGLDSGKEILR